MARPIEFSPERGQAEGPIYVQIYEYLKGEIEEGRLADGEYLPAESTLAEDFGVSLGTVKKAMRKLKSDGLVERRKGHGTRVTAASGTPRQRDEEAMCVLLGRVKESFWAEIYGGILSELEGQSYKPILIERDESFELESRAIRKYRDVVGGFIIAPTSEKQNRALYGELLAKNIPFVFIDRYLPELNVGAVVSDNEQGGYVATRHLLEQGHRRIALLGATDAVSVKKRIEGYKKALGESDVEFDEELVFEREMGAFEHGYQMSQHIVKQHPCVTAAFCMRDDTAWGCLRGLSQVGVKVPEEFSVIGYDDNEDICCRLDPPLTTVRQAKEQMGVEAASKLVEKMEGTATEERKVLSLPVELVTRQSVGPVPEAVSGSDQPAHKTARVQGAPDTVASHSASTDKK